MHEKRARGAGGQRSALTSSSPKTGATITIAIDDKAVADACFSVVGFLKFAEDGSGSLAGSGTFARLGHLGGILTAGHVIKNLPESRTNKPVGLVRFSGPSSQIQNYRLSMFYTDNLVLWDGVDGTAPDIAFLLVPATDVAALEAAGAVFYNLDKPRDYSPSDKDHRMAMSHAVVGSVEEWTESVDVEERKGRKLIVGAIFGAAKIIKRYEENKTELIDLVVDYSSMSRTPESYEGVSGAPFWELHVELRGETIVAIRKKLEGVAFRQAMSEAQHLMTCNGPSVVKTLIDEMQRKWPAK